MPGKRYDITPKQSEVLQLIADGKTTVKIAKALGNAPSTIDKIRVEMLRRFDAEHSAHLVAIGFRKGWIE